jgi:trans-aconitate 2-methyltransferase
MDVPRPPHGTGRIGRFRRVSAPRSRGSHAGVTGRAATTFLRVTAEQPGWDPAVYLRYAGERARPFLDLVGRVDAEAPSAVVDLGCGEGTMTATLARRWPHARVTGVDSSPEMLAAAAASAVPGRVEFVLGDVRDWAPDGPVDVVVSNAVLHWVPGHEQLLTRWAGWLRPGGLLAVQVPGNFRAPTHALLAELCRSSRWAARLADAAPRPDTVLEPAGYFDVLAAAGLSPDVWETTYLHVLRGDDPVLGWVRSTVLRPVLALLADDDAAAFTAEYAAALRSAYPARPDGTTLLPFRRVFAVAGRP